MPRRQELLGRHPPVKELVRRLREIGRQDGDEWIGNHPEEFTRYILRAGFAHLGSPGSEYLRLTALGEYLANCR